jgi:hypothetical protein
MREGRYGRGYELSYGFEHLRTKRERANSHNLMLQMVRDTSNPLLLVLLVQRILDIVRPAVTPSILLREKSTCLPLRLHHLPKLTHAPFWAINHFQVVSVSLFDHLSHLEDINEVVGGNLG